MQMLINNLQFKKMALSKTKIRKEIYRESYKKGLYHTDLEVLCNWIKQAGVVVHIQAAGKNDDDTEFVQLKIDGFKP